MRSWKVLSVAAVALLVAAACVAPAAAMPPSPYLQKKMAASPALERKIEARQAAARAKGVESPQIRRVSLPKGQFGPVGAYVVAAPPASGTVKTLTLLVDFPDKPAATAASSLDALMYGDVVGPTSLRGYYREVSQSRLNLVGGTGSNPATIGWLRLPHDYAYYCGSGDADGLGTYPNNCQRMVEDAVALANAKGVDFSQFDNNGDGEVDALTVIHAGTGAELGGVDGIIWSHKWNTSSYISVDGVNVFDYSTEPEFWQTSGDMTVGVYAHEMGHVLGLPDLYDTSYKSEGVGEWSLMGGGSWNGTLGNLPSRPDAWSAIRLGFAPSNAVTTETAGMAFDAATSDAPPTIARLAKGGATGGSEYFLVENRQQTGTDAGLPGAGLLIWHIDDTADGNSDRDNPLVGLVEAHGGARDLYDGTNRGDAGDPFPGTTSNTRFAPDTDPNSMLYDATPSLISVFSISPSAQRMTADIGFAIASLDLRSVGSSTHPDESVWYASRNVTLTWAPTTTYNLDGFAYAWSQDPAAPLTGWLPGTVRSLPISGVSPGVWYFRIAAVANGDIESAVHTYVVRIGASPTIGLSFLRGPSVLAGTSATVSGIVSVAGAPYAGDVEVLRAVGAAAAHEATVTAGADGRFAFSRPVTSTATYYVRIPANGPALEAMSGALRVTCYESLSMPSASATRVKAGRTVIVRGTVKPGCLYGTKLAVYRKVGSTYRWYTTLTPKAYNATGATAYWASLKLPYRGSYYVRARHACVRHVTSVSSARYLSAY